MPDFDKIFAVTSNPTDDEDYFDDRKPPYEPEKYSILGLKMEADNEIITEEGVHVYNKDPGAAKRLVNVVKKFPKI